MSDSTAIPGGKDNINANWLISTILNEIMRLILNICCSWEPYQFKMYCVSTLTLICISCFSLYIKVYHFKINCIHVVPNEVKKKLKNKILFTKYVLLDLHFIVTTTKIPVCRKGLWTICKNSMSQYKWRIS